MLQNDVEVIKQQIYSSMPMTYKNVENAMTYYGFLKDKIDAERESYQPPHTRVEYTDATDNIAQSFVHDWLFFDEVYNAFGTISTDMTEDDLVKRVNKYYNGV